MKKKLIAFLLSFALLVSSAVLMVSCGEDEQVHEKSSAYSFVFDEALGGLVVDVAKAQNISYLSAVVIPESSYYWSTEAGGNETDHSEAKAVVGIKEGAFKNNPSIGEVVLPKYLKSIGNEAFYGCTSLERVAVGSNLTSIGEKAFSGCGELRYFDLSSELGETNSEVKTIGSEAFNSCLRLHSLGINFASGCTIGEKAFYYAANLPNLDLTKVSYVGSKAFVGYNPSKTISTPSSTSNWAADWKG